MIIDAHQHFWKYNPIKDSEFAKNIGIKSAKVLGGKEDLKFIQSENALSVENLGEKTGNHAHVVEFTIGTR